MSVRWFKLKRATDGCIEFVKNVSSDINYFFRKILFNKRIIYVGTRVKNTKNQVMNNLWENKHNWKNRIIENHGFRIDEQDA